MVGKSWKSVEEAERVVEVSNGESLKCLTKNRGMSIHTGYTGTTGATFKWSQ